MRPINVLLLLSKQQEPYPTNEVLTLQEWAERELIVPLATTRRVYPCLRKGKSKVVVYDDENPNQDLLLAEGVFEGFVGSKSANWNERVRDYKKHMGSQMLPETLVGFLLLSVFQIRENKEVGSLNGFLDDRAVDDAYLQKCESSGSPFGLEKAAVYFVEGSPPSGKEKERMLRAKREELHSKIVQLAKLWRREKRNVEEQAKKLDREKAIAVQLRNERVEEKAKSRELEEWFVATAFTELDLIRDSKEILLECLDQQEPRDFLRALNKGGEEHVTRYKPKAIATAKHWKEVKPNGGRNALRVYYSQKTRGGTSRYTVLISSKKSQDADFKWMKRFKF